MAISVGRRQILQMLAVGGAAAASSSALTACSKGGSGAGGGGPITIGALNPTSGTNAIFGELLKKGQKIALAEVHGKVSGTDVQLEYHNTASDLDKALSAVRDADSNFFTGTWVSSNALAVGKLLNRTKGVFTTTTGADELTGSGCQRSLFRWSVTTYGSVQNTVRPLLKEHPDWKRWYSISPKYIFGTALMQAEKDVIQAGGATFTGNAYHALDETEFSGYVNKAVATKPDVILLNNYGTQAYSTIKAMDNLGVLKDITVVMPYAEGVLDFQQLGPRLSEGIYAGSQYWYRSDAPGNHYLVKQAREKYGTVPTYPMCAGYVSTKIILLGIEKAKSTDPVKVVKALEGLTYKGPTGSETIRAEDHQVVKNFYLLRGKGKGEIKSKYDVATLESVGNRALPASKSGCDMPDFGS